MILTMIMILTDDHDDVGAVEWSWVIKFDYWYNTDDNSDDNDIGAFEWRWVIECDYWCDTDYKSECDIYLRSSIRWVRLEYFS